MCADIGKVLNALASIHAKSVHTISFQSFDLTQKVETGGIRRRDKNRFYMRHVNVDTHTHTHIYIQCILMKLCKMQHGTTRCSFHFQKGSDRPTQWNVAGYAQTDTPRYTKMKFSARNADVDRKNAFCRRAGEGGEDGEGEGCDESCRAERGEERGWEEREREREGVKIGISQGERIPA